MNLTICDVKGIHPIHLFRGCSFKEETWTKQNTEILLLSNFKHRILASNIYSGSNSNTNFPVKRYHFLAVFQTIWTWNSKQPFINGSFNWMIPNLYIGNGWKSPNIHFKLVCLGYQVPSVFHPTNPPKTTFGGPFAVHLLSGEASVCTLRSVRWTSLFWTTTHLKNILVKMGSSSPIFGMKMNNFWNYHLAFFWPSFFHTQNLRLTDVCVTIRNLDHQNGWRMKGGMTHIPIGSMRPGTYVYIIYLHSAYRFGWIF